MENPPAHFPAWPGGAEVAVALTFDVDGEAPWLSEGPGYARRLTTLSQGRFGPARGLGRILGLLAELEVTATFYVPGHTADQHPGAVEAIVAGGHEVGHQRVPAPRHRRSSRCGKIIPNFAASISRVTATEPTLHTMPDGRNLRVIFARALSW